MPRAALRETPAKQIIAIGLKSWATYSNRAIEGILEYARRHKGFAFRDLIWSQPEQLPDLLKRIRPSGAILSLNSAEFALIRDALPGLLPVVSIGADTLGDQVGVVCSDDRAMVNLAIEHLSGAGYRRLGFVGGKGSMGSARREELIRRKRAKTAVFHIEKYRSSDEPDDAAIAELQTWLRNLQLPIGLIVWNSSIASSIVLAADAMGLRVPRDLGILSLADDQFCLCGEPPISAIDVDGNQLGHRAMTMLVAMLRSRRAPNTIEMVEPVGVIVRQSTKLASQSEDYVETALRFIEQNALRGIVIKNVLAALPGISRTRFYMEFTERVGCSPADYIRRHKITKAKELLLGSSLSVTRIATMCGFASTTQFGDTFRREVGITPLSFRRNR